MKKTGQKLVLSLLIMLLLVGLSYAAIPADPAAAATKVTVTV